MWAENFGRLQISLAIFCAPTCWWRRALITAPCAEHSHVLGPQDYSCESGMMPSSFLDCLAAPKLFADSMRKRYSNVLANHRPSIRPLTSRLALTLRYPLPRLWSSSLSSRQGLGALSTCRGMLDSVELLLAEAFSFVARYQVCPFLLVNAASG